MIPSILHQIWLGPEPIDDRVKPYMEKAQTRADQYHLWTNDNVWDEIETTREAFADYWKLDAQNSVALGDVLRVMLVQRFGGFYADADVELHCPVSVLQDHSFVVVTNAPLITGAFQIHINGGCFGAEANHLVCAALLQEMEKRKNMNQHWTDRIGYIMFQDVAARYKNDITLLNLMKTRRFQTHHELGSWHKNYGR